MGEIVAIIRDWRDKNTLQMIEFNPLGIPLSPSTGLQRSQFEEPPFSSMDYDNVIFARTDNDISKDDEIRLEDVCTMSIGDIWCRFGLKRWIFRRILSKGAFITVLQTMWKDANLIAEGIDPRAPKESPKVIVT